MQGNEYTIDMLLLALDNYDIVFGVQWLSTLGDILWNFKELQMRFKLRGEDSLLKGSDMEELKTIDREQMEKLLLRKDQLAAIQLCSLQLANSCKVPIPSSGGRSLDPELATLLKEFEDIFEERKGLPPKRAQDHKIPLKEGSQPVNIRPYSISRPLTDLLKKDAFQWTEVAQEAFDRLKEAMTITPVLALLDFSKEFVVETDASGVGIGAVLMQEGHPIAYVSKVLAPKHQALSVYERELFAILYAVKKWGHYLMGKHFIIKIDHQSLKYLLEQRLNTSLQNTWLAKLLGYDCEINYRKGKENAVVDALSRVTSQELLLMAVSVLSTTFLEKIQESWKNDPKEQGRTLAYPGLLQPLPMPRAVFTDNNMDFIEGLPKSLGKETEIVNKGLETYLRCMTGDKPAAWAKWLSMAEWWYNTTYHSSTRVTPFEGLYGFQPPFNMPYFPHDSAVAAVDTYKRDREGMIKVIKHHLQRAQDRMKFQADKKRSDKEFSIGDMVFLKLQPYRQGSVIAKSSEKLSPRYYGPYRIMDKVGKVAYKLNLPSSAQVHPVFHVSQLKKAIGTASCSSKLPNTDDTSDERLPQPLAILEHRIVKRGNQTAERLLIYWSNSSPADATWEYVDELRLRFPQFNLAGTDFKGAGNVMGQEV
ncbi:hypothetical protein CRG98_034001 [Punica granatum]|uniref:Uncharacterized protein n=1 Tax=Punica granatum TaxID=22663 RepID=A0A2I0INV5_PUNGR|nr:hypothetical protein CRG98_034001 [Punica granatum]